MFQSMPDRAKTSPLPVREAQGQPLVLVVEDEAALVTLLRYNLEREGFRVIDAANGEEALLIVKEQPGDDVSAQMLSAARNRKLDDALRKQLSPAKK